MQKPPLNRSDLVSALSARFPELGTEDVDTAVKTIVEAIGHTLVRGERVEIRGFGSFNVAIRPSRASRNPKTGAAVTVPPKAAPRFKPGQQLRERVDNARAQAPQG
jgi:integration host factor subunit beta